MNKIICVTGKSGSGKSSFSKLLAEKLNAKFVDVDIIAHNQYLKPEVLKNMELAFGKSIFENNKIDTKKLGMIVFNNKQKMQTLTNITWPAIKQDLEKIIGENKITVLDWAMFPNTDYLDKCFKSVLVKADEQKRMQYVLKRDNIGKDYFLLRERAGLNYDKVVADFVLINNYNNQFFKDANIVINKILEEL